MADLDDEHYKAVILDIADDAVIADAIAPIFPELGAFQRLSDLSGIRKRSYSLFQEVPDALSRSGIDFLANF
ncbi:hypothetical protein YH62_26985 [Rhizobium sp. LC145]|nr:hypothetical protein YH62_26985 [Rhizobium sp. LC145]